MSVSRSLRPGGSLEDLVKRMTEFISLRRPFNSVNICFDRLLSVRSSESTSYAAFRFDDDCCPPEFEPVTSFALIAKSLRLPVFQNLRPIMWKIKQN